MTKNMPPALDLIHYRKGSSLTDHQRRRLHLVQSLSKGLTGVALDYGCGYGDITYALSQQFQHIDGVDIGEDRVAWARREFAPILFSQCSPDGLTYRGATFDVVISVVVINWVDHPDRYLQEVHRVLKPHGHLVIVLAAPHRIQNALRKLGGKPPMKERYWTEPLNVFCSRLAAHGFSIEVADGFYESFADSVGNWKDLLVQNILLPMRLARKAASAPYYGVRAIKQH